MATTPPPIQLDPLKSLQSIDQMELFNMVDALRAEGLGEITSLPQLVVCGDQSSGKSSLLEAVSGIPFPSRENLCTRFATEVVLRRTPTTDLKISIVRARQNDIASQKHSEPFTNEISTTENFPELFRKAADIILRSAKNTFSKDILRIEFSGPTQAQLTLVDLPGLIHSHTESQTPEDVEIVSNLVSSYMENPRSIILAVVSAKYDIGLQIILRRARMIDPHGTRTLGIITKPDTLIPGSQLEETFIKLARNQDVKFRHGWHVVRNLDSAKKENERATLETRDEEERSFFKKSNFRSLRANTFGITDLRTLLSKLLYDQIRQEFPTVVDDIQERILSTKAELEKLGPSRETLHDQQGFLIGLSQSFQTISQAAVRGDYDHEFFRIDEAPARRLCAELLNRHFEFAQMLRVDGALWQIVEDSSGRENLANSRTREEAIVEACKLLQRSRGRELPGLPNYLLIGELFREYSSPWEGLARGHVEAIWEVTNQFLDLVLQYLADDETHDKIRRVWLRPLMRQKLDLAYDKLEELIDVHKDFPFTCNHSFLDNRKRLRQERSDEVLQEKLDKEVTQSNQKFSVGEVARIFSSLTPSSTLDMDMVAAEDAFDNMIAYYEVALSLFMDNVPALAIHAPIIRKLYEMLSPTTVYNGIDSELIKKIAGESEGKIAVRKDLQSRLAVLESGLKIYTQYAIRPQSKTKPAMPPLSENVRFGEVEDSTSNESTIPPSNTIPQKSSQIKLDPVDSAYEAGSAAGGLEYPNTTVPRSFSSKSPTPSSKSRNDRPSSSRDAVPRTASAEEASSSTSSGRSSQESLKPNKPNAAPISPTTSGRVGSMPYNASGKSDGTMAASTESGSDKLPLRSAPFPGFGASNQSEFTPGPSSTPNSWSFGSPNGTSTTRNSKTSTTGLFGNPIGNTSTATGGGFFGTKPFSTSASKQKQRGPFTFASIPVTKKPLETQNEPLNPVRISQVRSTPDVQFRAPLDSGITSSSQRDRIESVTAMPEFRHLSFEELRLVDMS